MHLCFSFEKKNAIYLYTSVCIDLCLSVMVIMRAEGKAIKKNTTTNQEQSIWD